MKMKQIKVLIVIGTRPEVIKLAPVIFELKRRRINTQILVTGQHKELLNQTLKTFDIKPDFNLKLMKKNQDLEDLSSRIFTDFSKKLKRINPDLVILQGDTTTVAICALCCYYQKIPIAHVEAGLRSFDKFHPFPEEINRKVVDIITDLYFAPTKEAKKNLLNEGINKKNVFVTGNTVIDSLLFLSKKEHEFNNPKLKRLDEEKLIILVTIHRRESFGKPIKQVFQALKEFSKNNVQIVYPVHPNPNVKNLAYKMLSKNKNIILTTPLNYLDFINIIKKSYFILTDSGGVQEEAPTFGKPVLVLRNVTERPEGVKAGITRVIGTNKQRILKYCNLLLNNKKFYSKMSKKKNPYGDGKSAKRIVKIIKKWLRFQ